MRTHIQHSQVSEYALVEQWFLKGLSVRDFDPTAMDGTGPHQPDTAEEFDHALDEALLADNLVPVEPRGHCAELAPPPGTLPLFVLVVGSTVLWVVAREIANFWR